MSRIYYVSRDDCTDYEPRPGYWIAPLNDDDLPAGPFRHQDEAERGIEEFDRQFSAEP